jgi:hypothetical protein
MTTLDRSAIAQALAKAIAYKQCGQHERANEWAARLVRMLACSDILASDAPQGWSLAECTRLTDR